MAKSLHEVLIVLEPFGLKLRSCSLRLFDREAFLTSFSRLRMTRRSLNLRSFFHSCQTGQDIYDQMVHRCRPGRRRPHLPCSCGNMSKAQGCYRFESASAVLWISLFLCNGISVAGIEIRGQGICTAQGINYSLRPPCSPVACGLGVVG